MFRQFFMKFGKVLGVVIVLSLVGYVCYVYFSMARNQYKSPNSNVVLIVIDALRADHLNCYGYERQTAPNICDLANESILFKRAYAHSPSTKSSVASFFTSLYPSQHKVISNEDFVSDGLTTLAEILNDNGYYTFAVNANAVIQKKFNYNQGFDLWEDLNFSNEATLCNAFFVNTVFSRIFDGMSQSPFFSYLHYIDTHTPYAAPGEYARYFNPDYDGIVDGFNPGKHFRILKNDPSELAQLVNMYDNEIVYVDTKIGEVIARLKERGVYDDSLIIIIADHGEMFLEHNELEHSNGLFEEVLHVPLIVKMPHQTIKRVVNAPVQLADITPTILDILDISQDNSFVGASLLKNFRNYKRPIFSEHLRLNAPNPGQSLIVSDKKLIKSLEDGKFTLYYLAADPGEKVNAFMDAQRSKALVRELENHIKNAEKPLGDIEQQKVELDEDTISHFKSLGYMN